MGWKDGVGVGFEGVRVARNLREDESRMERGYLGLCSASLTYNKVFTGSQPRSKLVDSMDFAIQLCTGYDNPRQRIIKKKRYCADKDSAEDCQCPQLCRLRRDLNPSHRLPKIFKI